MTTYSHTPSKIAFLEGGQGHGRSMRPVVQQQQPRQHNSICIAQQQEGSRFVSDPLQGRQAPGSEPISG